MPEEPETPSSVAHVWRWFWEITNRRSPAFEGDAPLTYTELESWSKLTRNEIRPWEVKMIFLMDDAFLKQRAEEIKGMRERKKEQKK